MPQTQEDRFEIFIAVLLRTLDNYVILVRNNPNEDSKVAGEVVCPGTYVQSHQTLRQEAASYIKRATNLGGVTFDPEFLDRDSRQDTQRSNPDGDGNCDVWARYITVIWLNGTVNWDAREAEQRFRIGENVVDVLILDGPTAYTELEKTRCAVGRTPAKVRELIQCSQPQPRS